jgi:hypothetical protein
MDLDGDAVFELYEASFTDPSEKTLLASAAYDKDYRVASTSGNHVVRFDSDCLLEASKMYALVVSPTTATNISFGLFDLGGGPEILPGPHASREEGDQATWGTAVLEDSGELKTASNFSGVSTESAHMMGLWVTGVDQETGGGEGWPGDP